MRRMEPEKKMPNAPLAYPLYHANGGYEFINFYANISVKMLDFTLILA